MAADTTGLLASSSVTVQKWSKLLQYENYEHNFFKKRGFIGTVKGYGAASASKGHPWDDANFPIVEYNDLGRGQVQPGMGVGKNGTGDQLTITWWNRLTKQRKTGNSALEGNEQNPTPAFCKIYIDQWREAVEIVGAMSFKRVVGATKDSLRKQLLDLAVDYDEEDTWNAIYQGAAGHLVDLGHYSNTIHPNTYAYDGNHGTGADAVAALASDERMDTRVLDSAVRRYTWKTRPVTPIRTPYGKDVGVCVMSPEQLEDLCNDNKFWNLHKDAMSRVVVGDMKKHPLFSNAEYCYRSILIFSTTRVWNAAEAAIAGVGESVHGAVFLGARAVACAGGGFYNGEGMGDDDMGNTAYAFTESDDTDYGNKIKVGIHVVNGKRRMDFDPLDATGADSGDADVNQSSFVIWTETSGQGF